MGETVYHTLLENNPFIIYLNNYERKNNQFNDNRGVTVYLHKLISTRMDSRKKHSTRCFHNFIARVYGEHYCLWTKTMERGHAISL